MEYISASRIKTLTECKKMFYHKYVLEDLVDEDSPFAQLGTAIHKVLEIYRPNPTMPKKSMIGIFHKEFNPPPRYDWLKKDGYRMIWKMDMSKIVLGELLSVELEFEEEIDGVVYRGIIDKVERVDDEIVVTDYKTNKEAKPEIYYPQLAIYDLVVSKLYPGFKRRHELLYLRHNKSIPIVFPEQQILETKEVTQNVNSFVLENANDPSAWPRLDKKEKCCAYCPLAKSCW
jgi:CRISPR/Cas system-associated exonuclease Cas4 (RecB family)